MTTFCPPMWAGASTVPAPPSSRRAIRTSIEDSDRAVIMDFEKLVYISSAGLRAILLTAKSLQSRDAKLVLCSLSEQIREVFEISGFDKVLAIHPTRAAALAALKG